MRGGGGRPGAHQIPPDIRDPPFSPGLAHETHVHTFFHGRSEWNLLLMSRC